MRYLEQMRKDERGVTLMDTVVGSALMLLVFIGIAGVFQLSIDIVRNNRFRAGAIALGNERMEYLRSLAYGSIGVIGGIPSGNVAQIEEVTLGDMTFTRRTSVQYSDDPGDGLGAADQNSIIADYKTIRVEVSWASREGERSTTLVGRVSPAGIETAVPGGVLTINVVDSEGDPLQDAQVDIANTGTSPTINIRTYTNSAGQVSFIGAPAASNYQITVSRPGYSTAQTYAVSVANPNPDPRHLTVSNNQTTSASFAIDILSSKTVQTYMQIREGVWSDTFASSANIEDMASTTVSGGDVILTGDAGVYDAEGEVQSVSVTPTTLYAWGDFSATSTTPSGTTLRFHFYDGLGDLIPDNVLSGNAAGFSGTSIDLSGISTSTYPSLRVGAELSTSNPAATPSIQAWQISYEYGPEPFPNFSFQMQGNKTIGNSPAVYKYQQTHSSGASASVTLSNVEWDTYTITPVTSGYQIAESCNPQPEILAPDTTQTTRIYVLASTTNALLVDVHSSAGALIDGASVQLTRTGYNTTLATKTCGQAFFQGLSAATYSITVSKTGFQPYTNSNVVISGYTKLPIILNP